jgi:hypothetical protein
LEEIQEDKQTTLALEEPQEEKQSTGAVVTKKPMKRITPFVDSEVRRSRDSNTF